MVTNTQSITPTRHAAQAGNREDAAGQAAKLFEDGSKALRTAKRRLFEVRNRRDETEKRKAANDAARELKGVGQRLTVYPGSEHAGPEGVLVGKHLSSLGLLFSGLAALIEAGQVSRVGIDSDHGFRARWHLEEAIERALGDATAAGEDWERTAQEGS